jgi:hypothetical protein
VKPNAFARWVVRLRVPILIATALLTLVLGWFLKDTRINADISSYLPDKDPAVQLNRYIGRQYGGTQLAVVGLEAEDAFAPRAAHRRAAVVRRGAGHHFRRAEGSRGAVLQGRLRLLRRPAVKPEFREGNLPNSRTLRYNPCSIWQR